jgi:hypothetical protein
LLNPSSLSSYPNREKRGERREEKRREEKRREEKRREDRERNYSLLCYPWRPGSRENDVGIGQPSRCPLPSPGWQAIPEKARVQGCNGRRLA